MMGLGTTVWTTGRPCPCAAPFGVIITDGEREWCSVGCGFAAEYAGARFDPLAPAAGEREP